MKLWGSRANGTPDEFSDWDHLIESREDFATVHAAMDTSAIWKFNHSPGFRVLAVVDRDGRMFDYSEYTGGFDAEWKAIADLQTNPKLGDYWTLAFKHLKALYRRESLIHVGLGIELSTSAARDLYMERRYGVTNYMSFFRFKKIAAQVEGDTTVSRVTGMAYATREEVLVKLRAMNAMIVELDPGSEELAALFERRASLL